MREASEGSLRQRLGREDGQTLILVVLTLPLLLAMMMLVIDGASLMVQREAVQNAADAAALAASASLDPSSGTCTNAHLDPSSASCVASVDQYSLDTGGPSSLDPCDVTHTTNCYAAPYVDKNGVSHPQQIEVRLTKKVSTFFGGFMGLSNFDISARAVGGLSSGAPPAYTFVALNSTNEKHTLQVRLGGRLKVTNAIYVDSNNLPDDAFDIFGTGGNIAAPDIRVRGGWETHNGSTVTVNGTTCLLTNSGTGAGYFFQDPAQAVSDTKCDGRSADTWDVALLNLGSKGLNAISGTVYAPDPHAVFADSVSGTANLAVLAGYIYIGGGDSTFEYQASGLFGTGLALAE